MMKRLREVFGIVLCLSLVALVGWALNQKAPRPKPLPYLSQAVRKKTELSMKTLLIVDSREEVSKDAQAHYEQMLKDMRYGYQVWNRSSGETLPNLKHYERLVLLLPSFDLIEDKREELQGWLRQGGQLLFGLAMTQDESSASWYEAMGIRDATEGHTKVSSLYPKADFLMGGGKSYTLDQPFESSWKVQLRNNAQIYMWGNQKDPFPLVWTCGYGKGKVVVDNIGFYEKANRGLHMAVFSLLGDYTIYPVINGKSYVIDDFPAPIPSGRSSFIEKDYSMTIQHFFRSIWWPDLIRLSRKWKLPFTGAAIENYGAQTKGPFTYSKNENLFAESLLDQGGDIAFHGYNHQPLALSTKSYKDRYPAYRAWPSMEDMRASLRCLREAISQWDDRSDPTVYVPPSNVLTEEGRQMIKATPGLRTIAASYFGGDAAYEQEFTWGEDGIIDAPRTVAGYAWDDFNRLTILSEVNGHFVHHQFFHPDDLLDKERGGDLGWKNLYKSLNQNLRELEEMSPQLRALTTAELGAAIQRYDNISIQSQRQGGGIGLKLDGFVDEAYLLVRLPDERLRSVEGGKFWKLREHFYLLKADSANLFLSIEKGK